MNSEPYFELSAPPLPIVPLSKGKQVLERCREKAQELLQTRSIIKKQNYDAFWEKYYCRYCERLLNSDAIEDTIIKSMSLKYSDVSINPDLKEDTNSEIFLYVAEHGYKDETPILDLLRERYPEPEFTVLINHSEKKILIRWENVGDEDQDNHRCCFG
jgi:hypothetical protein